MKLSAQGWLRSYGQYCIYISLSKCYSPAYSYTLYIAYSASSSSSAAYSSATNLKYKFVSSSFSCTQRQNLVICGNLTYNKSFLIEVCFQDLVLQNAPRDSSYNCFIHFHLPFLFLPFLQLSPKCADSSNRFNLLIPVSSLHLLAYVFGRVRLYDSLDSFVLSAVDFVQFSSLLFLPLALA